MAYRLEPLLSEIAPRIAAQFPAISFGYSHVDENEIPPRVVWLNRIDSFERNEQPRGGAVLSRVVGVTAWVWGEDEQETDDIVEAIANALHALIGDAFSPGSVTWSATDQVTEGAIAQFEFTVRVPLQPAPAWTTVVPTSYAYTPATAGDGILEPTD